jgi:hypothetical protein
MGEKSSSDEEAFFPFGVFGRLPFRELGFFHRLMLPDPVLSLLTSLDVSVPCVGVWGTLPFAAGGGAELKSIESPNTSAMLSSTVFTDPSRAFEDVVGANPESLLNKSLFSRPLIGRRRNAGCVSVGGARGGATVTAMGGFAATVSSYRTVINPSSVRVQVGVAVDFMRRLPEFSGAILHDLEVLVSTGVVMLQSRWRC